MAKRCSVNQGHGYRLRGKGRQAARYASLAQCEATVDLSTLNPASVEWQDAMWRRWPRAADWPDVLSVYESAAYLRISYDSMRRGIAKDRAGFSAVKHQEFGRSARIRKADLDQWNVVPSNRGMRSPFRIWPPNERL